MSLNEPRTCGRIASRSKAPASGRTTGRMPDTVKWLDQKATSRSISGVGESVAAR